jgi:hypothetical protein
MLRAMLDAIYFHLYGITACDDMRYVYSTFHMVGLRGDRHARPLSFPRPLPRLDECACQAQKSGCDPARPASRGHGEKSPELERLDVSQADADRRALM